VGIDPAYEDYGIALEQRPDLLPSQASFGQADIVGDRTGGFTACSGVQLSLPLCLFLLASPTIKAKMGPESKFLIRNDFPGAAKPEDQIIVHPGPCISRTTSERLPNA
jgi:hypothetical protein